MTGSILPIIGMEAVGVSSRITPGIPLGGLRRSGRQTPQFHLMREVADKTQSRCLNEPIDCVVINERQSRRVAPQGSCVALPRLAALID